MATPRLRRAAAPAVALVALLLTACGSSTGGPSAAAGDGADPPLTVATTSPLTGSFDTIAGGQIELSSLEGQDVVLWFWAPW